MDFADVQRRVIDLYGKEVYDRGLEVIAEARPLVSQLGRAICWHPLTVAVFFGEW